MPHDRDEKPPPPNAPPAFDFNKLPRWRSKLFPAPDDPPAEPAPLKPVPAPEEGAAVAGEGEKSPTPAPETAHVFDLDSLPRVRPNVFVTPDDRPGGAAPRKPTPTPALTPRKTTGQDRRARTLAERANEPPPRVEEPPGARPQLRSKRSSTPRQTRPKPPHQGPTRTPGSGGLISDPCVRRNSAVAPLTLFQTAFASPDRCALPRPQPLYPHGAETGPRRHRQGADEADDEATTGLG